MSSSSSSTCSSMLLFVPFLLLSSVMVASAGNFNDDFNITWGDGRAKIPNDGQFLTLSLDKASGSGFQSQNEYLVGQIDMQIKLVAGNSAGTVTAYYLRSDGDKRDEIDFEFLGNLSGNPYVLHTNVFSQGKGNRAQRFFLWFDPSADYHTYSILWNPQRIVFFVDDTPIREFRNQEVNGVPFPTSQPMQIQSSLRNADDWAKMGGRVQTDWNAAPFTTSYRNFTDQACVWDSVSSSSSCGSRSTATPPASAPGPASSNDDWFTQGLDTASQGKMRWVQNNYMIYNYCTDVNRFPQGLPIECFT